MRGPRQASQFQDKARHLRSVRVIKMRCNVRESDVPCNVLSLGSMINTNVTGASDGETMTREKAQMEDKDVEEIGPKGICCSSEAWKPTKLDACEHLCVWNGRRRCWCLLAWCQKRSSTPGWDLTAAAGRNDCWRTLHAQMQWWKLDRPHVRHHPSCENLIATRE